MAPNISNQYQNSIIEQIEKNNICLQILPNQIELRDSKVQIAKDIFLLCYGEMYFLWNNFSYRGSSLRRSNTGHVFYC